MSASTAALIAMMLRSAQPTEGAPAQVDDGPTVAPDVSGADSGADPDASSAPTQMDSEPSSSDEVAANPDVPETEASPDESSAASEVTGFAESETPTPEAPKKDAEMLTVSQGAGEHGPPYYTEADAVAFRAARDVREPSAESRQAKWRCLIADPTCGFNLEVNATSAYTHRFQQGDVRSPNARRWASGRAQYDVWANIPVIVEQEGRSKFTRMTVGPKGGVAFSDGGTLWGNLGVAARYWFGRGRWAPTLEFTSALSFKIGSRQPRGPGDSREEFQMTRGPVGFTADVGVGLGGFGALVVGGQYDSPLAREEVPSNFHVSASGAFFVGFRGNILWGGPAAAAVLTHTLTQRYAEEPQ